MMSGSELVMPPEFNSARGGPAASDMRSGVTPRGWPSIVTAAPGGCEVMSTMPVFTVAVAAAAVSNQGRTAAIANRMSAVPSIATSARPGRRRPGDTALGLISGPVLGSSSKRRSGSSSATRHRRWVVQVGRPRNEDAVMPSLRALKRMTCHAGRFFPESS